MTDLNIILAISSFLFLLLLFALKLDEETHYIFRYILITFFVVSLPLLPKAILDTDDSCSYIIRSTTLSGNTTTYTHDYQCTPSAHNTPSTMLKVITWFQYTFWLYVFLYIIWDIFGERIRKMYEGIIRR